MNTRDPVSETPYLPTPVAWTESWTPSTIGTASPGGGRAMAHRLGEQRVIRDIHEVSARKQRAIGAGLDEHAAGSAANGLRHDLSRVPRRRAAERCR